MGLWTILCNLIPGIQSMESLISKHQYSKFYLDSHFTWSPVLIWQAIANFCALKQHFIELPFLCASQSEFANERNLLKTEKAAGMTQISLSLELVAVRHLEDRPSSITISP